VSTQEELRAAAAAAGQPLVHVLRATSREQRAGEQEEPGPAAKLHHRGAGGLAEEAEAVWSAAAHAVTRCAPPQAADADTLAALAPAFAAALGTTSIAVSNRAVEAWNASFGRAALPLEYPAELRAALARLSKKAAIEAPGLRAEDVAGAPTTPPSAERSDSSDDVRPRVAASPARAPRTPLMSRGSLLSPAPRPHASPLRPTRSPQACPARLAPAALPAAEQGGSYERIEPAQQRRLVLTEHQREALRAHAEERPAGALSYTGLEDAESRLAFAAIADVATRSDSRTQWSRAAQAGLAAHGAPAPSAETEALHASPPRRAGAEAGFAPPPGGLAAGDCATPQTAAKRKLEGESAHGDEVPCKAARVEGVAGPTGMQA